MTFTPDPGQRTHPSKGNSAEAPDGKARGGACGVQGLQRAGSQAEGPIHPSAKQVWGHRDQLSNPEIGKVTRAWGPWSPFSGAGSGQTLASRVPLSVLKAQP